MAKAQTVELTADGKTNTLRVDTGENSLTVELSAAQVKALVAQIEAAQK